jgi:endogenous inhibitor of DNA gyrase (YacG/DUF329 family)
LPSTNLQLPLSPLYQERKIKGIWPPLLDCLRTLLRQRRRILTTILERKTEMAVIETAYDIGDTVFNASTMTETFAHPCPDCLGSRKWKATSPAGGEFEVECPRCGSGYQSNRALNLRYVKHTPYVRKLTIGSFKAAARTGSGHYDDGNSYMCVETGVGSGSVYNERDLYRTGAEALAASKIKAAFANEDQAGWVAKQYAETVKFSDYQLKDAQMEAALDAARYSQVRIGILIEDIEQADDAADAKAIVERWRERIAEDVT